MAMAWPLAARSVSPCQRLVLPESCPRTMTDRKTNNTKPIRFAEYDLVHLLGRGGMGEVWSAVKRWDVGVRRRVGQFPSRSLRRPSGLVIDPLTLNKSLALKVMHPRLSADPSYREMFVDETSITMQLTGSNIVSVFGIGEHEGLLYMAMERVDGVNLYEFHNRLLTAGGIVPLNVALYIVHEIVVALFVAHEHTVVGRPAGVIHRDIKPGNVLVSSVGDVLLTDFGIARPVALHDTAQTTVPGTLRYMAPEQARGFAGIASDLFQVGAILQELLTGRRFRDECQTDDDLRRAIADETMPRLDRAVASHVEQLRRGLLHPDPARRFKSAREVLSMRRAWADLGNARLTIAELYEQIIGSRSSGFTRVHEAARPSFLADRPELEDSPPTVSVGRAVPAVEDLDEAETTTYAKMPWSISTADHNERSPPREAMGRQPDTNAPRHRHSHRGAAAVNPIAAAVTAPRPRPPHPFAVAAITPTELLESIAHTPAARLSPALTPTQVLASESAAVHDLDAAEASVDDSWDDAGSVSGSASTPPSIAAGSSWRMEGLTRFRLLAALALCTAVAVGIGMAWLLARSSPSLTSSTEERP